MIEKLDDAERDELDRLLPWYANGTLDQKDVARVEAALQSDERLARSLSLIRDDQSAAVEAADAIDVPDSIEARFRSQLDGEKKRTADVTKEPVTGNKTDLFAKLGAWLNQVLFGHSPQRLGLIATAAAIVIAIQAGVITAMVGSNSPGEGPFTTASGDPQTAAVGGKVFLVQFANNADVAALAGFLNREKARMIDGPLPGGFFKIRFDKTDGRNTDDLTELLRREASFFRLVLPNG